MSCWDITYTIRQIVRCASDDDVLSCSFFFVGSSTFLCVRFTNTEALDL